ncbi:hypothetical protein EJB05_14568, partial [Eragrostis curvula]
MISSFSICSPNMHAVLHIKVGAVWLPGDARAAAEENNELPHITQRGFKTFHHVVQSPAPTEFRGSPPEGVDCHRSVSNLQPLGFLNDDTSSQKRSLQPVGSVDGARLLVLADEEGEQSANEVARHRGQ